MKKLSIIRGLLSVACSLLSLTAVAQEYNQIDESGNITRRSDNGNFNKHNTDSTSNKEVPKGIHVWTIDRRFGDVRPTEPDTIPHLYMNTIFNTGVYGEYNTTGNNYTARLSRIFIDRPEFEEFIFTQPYSWFNKQPDQFHFTNTLSPFTNISYDNCGDKQNGEDHIDAKFAVNANKELGFGFDLNYAYARGYYAHQAASHFGATLYGSYLGDQYQLHALFNINHQKVAENGGITDDNYILHPESEISTFSTDEIPTVLSLNWNRNNNMHFLLSHRYSVGFYRQEKMTEEEIKARKFAEEAKPKKEETETPQGRPDDARVVGELPPDNGPVTEGNSRITVDSHEKRDSLLAAEALNDSTMKQVFVPVTSFIHTLDLNNYDRIYQASDSPDDYYANTYFDRYDDLQNYGDSIYDNTKHLSVKNTLAIALLEGFNKYAKAGLKVFASHEYRRYQMPDTIAGQTYSIMNRWTEHDISIGGQINKTQGKTLHYNLMAEAWVAGACVGDLAVDFNTDLNFPLFGDTVQLAANASLHRISPGFYLCKYHSKHFWWDGSLDKENRLHLEGLFSYTKTNTQLRVAIDEVKNYTYLGMSYDYGDEARKNYKAKVYQESGNINILTAQLRQNFRLGILNWENIITYQNSSNQDVLPLPALNIWSNLYIKFKVVKQLTFEIGGDVTFFTKYEAPDFCPQLNQFAIQQNPDSRVELGGYPFVDVYANMHLKRTRFFVMYSHVNAGGGSRNYFLTPHYPMNEGTLRLGVSWNFYN